VAVTLLVASLLALASAPLLLVAARRSPPLLQLLDGFVFVAIGGLVLLHVLPEAFEQAGWWVLLAGGLGMLAPTIIEERLEHSARSAHMTALVLACVGLLLHSLLDGAVLAGVARGDAIGPGAGYAVVLHFLPEGLMLWSLLSVAFGRAVAVGSLFAVALAIVSGFFIGAAFSWDSHAMSSMPMGLFLGLVGGSLLHVVVHRPHVDAPHAQRGWQFPAGVGALAGGGLLWLMQGLQRASGSGHGEGSDVHTELANHAGDSVLLSLVLESAPALLLAYLAAGMVQSFLPKASVRWLSRGSTLSQAARGMVFGLPLPLCSCGVIPVYRSLVLKGAPPAAAAAFLVATPELGLDAVLLSVPLLGVHMTWARVVCAALAALLVGWWLGRVVDVTEPAPGAAVEEDEFAGMTFGGRLTSALRTGYGEMVDGTAPWILLGLVVAALAVPWLDVEMLEKLPDHYEVLLCAALGMPIYVCASGATPLVAVLLAAGVSPGAGIAFLLAGPATNVTTFGVLSSLHGRKASIAFAASVTVSCVVLGLAVNAILPTAGQGAFKPAEHSNSTLQWVCAASLGLVYLASVLRQGPRDFVGQLSFAEQAGHDHDHHHDEVACCPSPS